MKKLLFLILLSSCHSGPPKKQYRYYIKQSQDVSIYPIECDSVRQEGACLTYYQDGRQGRVCGTFTVYPQ